MQPRNFKQRPLQPSFAAAVTAVDDANPLYLSTPRYCLLAVVKSLACKNKPKRSIYVATLDTRRETSPDLVNKQSCSAMLWSCRQAGIASVVQIALKLP